MVKKYIMTPGPTPISEEVMLEHARPLMHHRSPEFSKIFIEVTEKLKKLFKTKNDVFILTSSGTGAMEAAVTNFFVTGDKVLVASVGNFGERFKKISSRFKLEVISLDYEWGDAANPEDIKKALDDNPDIKGVMVQFSETSTGAINDIKAIGNIVKNYPAILIVDAISGLGASDMRTDEWNLDVVAGGSQKALSAPTGVAFISISDKAWKLNEKSDLPRFYFDLATAKNYSQKTPPQTPWTPGISIIVAMNKALDMLFEEGLEKVFKRHKVLALATQKAVEKLGLELLVKDENKRGFSVTSIKVPEGIDAKELTKTMRVKYGVTIAGGQGKLSGKIIRIGHLGYFGMFDIIIAISALEMTLKELGYNFEVGSGITEAERIFMENNYLND
ncbi:MAG: alanine--glyoxylate aminotransferase family protein [Actinobacteria bacterium]|nr:alanine--glyoxylate aminotransferase family protein [Actinomycetota bacterium]MBE3114375.1 alanine--glyoxylate aminotransferase family protein [Actinomycetota bacterium]